MLNPCDTSIFFCDFHSFRTVCLVLESWEWLLCVQTDQMAGQWYAWASGLPPLFDDAKARSALQKIYDFNVMKVKGGRYGAVNGMHPNGRVDETSMQSREIWTGVTYALSAAMIHEGMHEQAFQAAEGVFLAGWSDLGWVTLTPLTIILWNYFHHLLLLLQSCGFWFLYNVLSLQRILILVTFAWGDFFFGGFPIRVVCRV